MKTIWLLLSSMLLLAGCDKLEEVHYKYTVWVGSSAVAVGYDTNEVIRESTVVKFINTDGVSVTVPLCNVLKIDEDNVKDTK